MARAAHPQPLLLKRQNDSNPYQQVGLNDHDDDESGKGHGASHGGDGHGHGPFNFGEVMIHQGIETIEFVLGMVSNTASYLRLWALSLAHSQVRVTARRAARRMSGYFCSLSFVCSAHTLLFCLSLDDAPPLALAPRSQLAKVFWEKIMVPSISSANPVAIVVGFAVFAAVTTGVLLMMDVLECYLHALRLHWVEFQNKFYGADGHKFQPFFFVKLLTEVDE